MTSSLSPARTDLLGNELTPVETRLMAVYDELKALAADPDLPPAGHANGCAALALYANAVEDMGLVFEHLSDLAI